MYITKSNFKRIIRLFDIPEEIGFDDVVLWVNSKGDEIRGDWESRKKYFFSQIFSQKEKNQLLAFKAICNGDTRFIRYIYNKIESPVDTYKYIQAEKKPSYHSDIECKAMKSDFQRVYIPEQIQKQGVSKVLEFRKYWKDHSELREKDNEAFIAVVNTVFELDPPIRDFVCETIANSGTKTIEDNSSVNEINETITKVWEKFTNWVKEDKSFRMVAGMELGYLSWIGKSERKLDDVLDENTLNRKLRIVLRRNRTESELKEVLSKIDFFKNQLMDLLQELYIRSYIPNLDFEDNFLKSLGFEPCAICIQNEALEVDSLD